MSADPRDVARWSTVIRRHVSERAYMAWEMPPARPPWMEQAACASVDPDLFYPAEDHSPVAATRKAKAICAGCDVKADCLEVGINETYGIWAGLTQKERARLRKARGIAKRQSHAIPPDTLAWIHRQLDRDVPAIAIAEATGVTERHILRLKARRVA